VTLSHLYIISRVHVSLETMIVKDLGVILIYSHFVFDKHISEKVNKAYTMLGILRGTFTDVSCECFLNLYKTMVRPLLEYANTIWSPRMVCERFNLKQLNICVVLNICHTKIDCDI